MTSDLKQEYADYAYAVSHDLGAPVRQIKAFLELMFDDLDMGKTDDLEVYKAQCFQAIANADLILDRLLEFSRLNDHDVNIQSHTIIDFFPQNEQRLNIDIADDFKMNVDGQLFQIMVNELIDNALKFSDTKTDIYIDGGTLIFKTHDAMITEKFHNEIFKPLRTLGTKGDNNGCGMGLPIAKKAADLQGMTLQCRNHDHCVIMAISLK